MQTLDMAGAVFNAHTFIKVYKEAKKLAPPRFLTLHMNPDMYRDLYALAEIPESIQLGPTPGPLGTIIMRVACIKPLLGVSDGISVVQDDKINVGRMIFTIHGIPELEVVNFSYDLAPQSDPSSR